MKFQISKERCLKLAQLGEDHTISAGSLLSLQELRGADPCPETVELTIVRGVAFGRFVEMKRRDLDLSVEHLAEKAGIHASEAISIEEDPRYKPEPATVTRLARVLGVPQHSFFQLAGLIQPKSQRFLQETTKFAARSEAMSRLTAAERELLEDYEALLSEDA